jgi:medium-chain acyl-[acyl-carrier-protein] hydrolase
LKANSSIRLICLPYAGGNSALFRSWQEALPPHVHVNPVELPGHGYRIREPLLDSMPDVVETLAANVVPLLDRPFAIFGYSLGALIGFELSRHLRRYHDRIPDRLFVAACRAPSLPDPRPPLHNLPGHRLREELRRLGGTPKEVLKHDELMQLMLPMLRADFAVLETYEYAPDAPLSCPIIALGGTEDPEAPPATMEAWSRETTAGSALHRLPGGHFFIQSARDALLRIVASELTLSA